MRLLAIVLITLLFSCKSSKQEKIAEELQEINLEAIKEAFDFTEVKTGENSDYKKTQNIIIRTEEEMDLNWSRMFGKYPRKPPIPMIDFKKKQLLLVAAGEQPNGGYTIKVSAIEKSTKGILVTIENAKPEKSCNNTSVLTYPFQLIEMTKTEKEITFARVSKIKACK